MTRGQRITCELVFSFHSYVGLGHTRHAIRLEPSYQRHPVFQERVSHWVLGFTQ